MGYDIDVRGLDSEGLAQLARDIFDGGMEPGDILAELIRGDLSDHERIADIFSYCTVDSQSRTFYAADRREPTGKRYVDAFMSACARARIPEKESMAVLLSVKYARPGSELSGWGEAATARLTLLAKENFEAVADAIDRCDKKFLNYGVLIAADRRTATDLLIKKALYQKFVDKTAVRNALVGCPEITDELFRIYVESKVPERVAVVRLLKLFGNDAEVAEFLEDAAANDSSKTVRDTIIGRRKKRRTSPEHFFSELIRSGEALPYGEWKDILTGDGSNRYAAFADRLFFYLERDGVKSTIVFNDGRFYDINDKKLRLSDGDMISLLHPADIPAGEESILDIDIEQPVPQLSRAVYKPASEETYSSAVLVGTMIDRESFDRGFRKLGFAFAREGDGTRRTVVLGAGGYFVAAECDLPATGDTAECGTLRFFSAGDVVRNNRDLYISGARPLLLRSVPPRIYSELTAAVYALFDCAR